MTRWRELQDYLSSGVSFTCHDLAADWGITTVEASTYINAHVRAQRAPQAATLFVLRRSGRTTGSVWHASRRTKDAHALSAQCVEDIVVKVEDSLLPDLHRLAGINPQVTGLVSALSSAFAANVRLLEAAVLTTTP